MQICIPKIHNLCVSFLIHKEQIFAGYKVPKYCHNNVMGGGLAIWVFLSDKKNETFLVAGGMKLADIVVYSGIWGGKIRF